jgi:hypothetical protein
MDIENPQSGRPVAVCGTVAGLGSKCARRDEAQEQMHRYGVALRECYGFLTDLRCFAVVALGLRRVVWRAV